MQTTKLQRNKCFSQLSRAKFFSKVQSRVEQTIMEIDLFLIVSKGLGREHLFSIKVSIPQNAKSFSQISWVKTENCFCLISHIKWMSDYFIQECELPQSWSWSRRKGPARKAHQPKFSPHVSLWYVSVLRHFHCSGALILAFITWWS